MSRFNPVHPKAEEVIWRLARHLEAITHQLGCWPGRGWDSTGSEHPTGRALDWMISQKVGQKVSAEQKKVGDAVVDWLIRHSDQLRIRHIIWHNRIWKRRYRSNAGGGWSTHKGSSVSARHEDHVHVFLDNAGGSVPDQPLIIVSAPGGQTGGLSMADAEDILAEIREFKKLYMSETATHGVPYVSAQARSLAGLITALRGEVAGLTAALDSVKTGGPVDLVGVKNAVKEALAEAKLTVEF